LLAAMFGANNNANYSQADVQPLLQAGMQLIDSSAVHSDPNIAICGDDNQMLTITLKPGQSIIAQPGCMMWCEEGIDHEVSTGGLSNALTRACCANEDLFRVHWVNQAGTDKKISLTSSQILMVGQEGGQNTFVVPKRVVAINLDSHGNELVFSSGAFMAGMDPNLEFSVERTGRKGGGTVGKAVFGGQGLFLCTIRGRGLVFLNGSGTIVEKTLQAGETIVVDQNAVLAWASSVNFGYRIVRNFGMLCCGGEGLANTTLTGPGQVILQSVTTPASQQANPIGCVVCLIWVVLVFACFVIPALSAGAAAFEVEENAQSESADREQIMNENAGITGRRLLQNLTYEVGRRMFQNFTMFA